jgi:DNA-directed RNA polymerase specialized sigma24 family protein
MTTNDMVPRRPDGQEPPSRLLREVFDLIDETVEHVTDDEVHARLSLLLDATDYGDQGVGDAGDDAHARHHGLRAILRQIPSARTRLVLALTAEGYTHSEIADILADGTTPRAVEGLLYRHRKAMQRRKETA